MGDFGKYNSMDFPIINSLKKRLLDLKSIRNIPKIISENENRELKEKSEDKDEKKAKRKKSRNSKIKDLKNKIAKVEQAIENKDNKAKGIAKSSPGEKKESENGENSNAKNGDSKNNQPRRKIFKSTYRDIAKEIGEQILQGKADINHIESFDLMETVKD